MAHLGCSWKTKVQNAMMGSIVGKKNLFRRTDRHHKDRLLDGHTSSKSIWTILNTVLATDFLAFILPCPPWLVPGSAIKEEAIFSFAIYLNEALSVGDFLLFQIRVDLSPYQVVVD